MYFNLVIDSAHQPLEESLINSFAETITCKLTLSVEEEYITNNMVLELLTSAWESGVKTTSFDVSTLFFVRHCSSSSIEQPSISQAKVAAIEDREYT